MPGSEGFPTLCQRNNNPGNIRFTPNFAGAIGVAGSRPPSESKCCPNYAWAHSSAISGTPKGR